MPPAGACWPPWTPAGIAAASASSSARHEARAGFFCATHLGGKGRMKRFAMLTALLLASSLALAHGPTRQKVTETVTIKASPDAVWAKVKDFTNLQGWHPAVESSTATDGSKVGSVRTLKLKGGGEVIETLE